MEENIVKKVCRELGITQKELAEMMGVNEGTPAQWASKGAPDWAIKFIELLIESKKNKDAISGFKQFLKTISD